MSNHTKGFASMPLVKRREIASKGGKAAHAQGTAHVWDAEEARAAGIKGGKVSRGERGKLRDEAAATEGSRDAETPPPEPPKPV